jgi:hypothetical protein
MMQFLLPLSLAWIGLTSFGIVHVGLVIYAEIHNREPGKRKNEMIGWNTDRLALAGDDGELIDFPTGEVKSADNTEVKRGD